MVSRAWPKLGIPSPLTHYGLTEKNEAPLTQQTWAWAPFQCPAGCLSHHLHRVRRADRYVSFTETQEMVTWPLRFYDSSCLLSCSKGVTETEAALSWCLTLPSGLLPVTQDYNSVCRLPFPCLLAVSVCVASLGDCRLLMQEDQVLVSFIIIPGQLAPGLAEDILCLIHLCTPRS